MVSESVPNDFGVVGSVADAKAAIRKAMRYRRAGLALEQTELAGKAVAKRLSGLTVIAEASRVAAYRAVRGELPVEALTETGRWADFTFPRVRGQALEFVARFENQKFASGAFAIPEPVDGEVIALANHDVVLVPLTAFDACCHRVGQGGGFYDRALAIAKSTGGTSGSRQLGPVAIGVAYGFQQITEVPTEPWDVALDAVVTDSAIFVAPNWQHEARLAPRHERNPG